VFIAVLVYIISSVVVTGDKLSQVSLTPVIKLCTRFSFHDTATVIYLSLVTITPAMKHLQQN
jgi:hypothetical protein